MKVITNKQPRELLTWRQLTPNEQKEFDYFDPSEIGEFFRYKGTVYDFQEFVRVDHSSIDKFWHGYSSDSYFSGILVHLCKDNESVIVGRYYS